MKDMIHGMHAQKDRTAPFRDARDRTPDAITLLDFSRIAFPGVLKNCETCHKPGTYASVPATALASTQEFRDAAYVTAALGGLTTPAIAKAALTQPNPDDVVATPFAAACVSCHDDALAKSHIGLNGGIIGSTVGAQVVATDTRALMMSKGGPASETCSLCHGAGKIADVKVVHGQ
jgi:OmcA/MtrC family decaheme c-type cytochrome